MFVVDLHIYIKLEGKDAMVVCPPPKDAEVVKKVPAHNVLFYSVISMHS